MDKKYGRPVRIVVSEEEIWAHATQRLAEGYAPPFVIERPNCSCHDEPMTIRNDRKVGYKCSVGHRDAQTTYSWSSKGMRSQFKKDRRKRYGQT